MITSFVSPSYGLNANAHTFAMSVSMTTLPYALDVIQSRRPSAIANQAAVVFHNPANLIHVMKLVQFPGPPRAFLKPIETRQFGSSIRCESQSLRKSKGRLQKTKSGRFSQPSTQGPPHEVWPMLHGTTFQLANTPLNRLVRTQSPPLNKPLTTQSPCWTGNKTLVSGTQSPCWTG